MTSIFVAKLDFGVTNEQLRQLFEQHGSVIKVNVATDRETGKSRGFAFVEMADRAEAMNAINALNGHMINGRDIAVKEAEQRGDTRPNNNPRSGNDFQRTSTPRNDDRRPGSTPGSDSPIITPPIESLKIEPRKKVNKDKKPGDSDSDNRSKKPKMDAYKKSGKANRFFDDDDDDDFDGDLFSFNKSDEEDDFDEEDDEDFA
jgi:RNA recognition motif-containing protein